MRTNKHPLDYQPRRFNQQDHAKYMACHFDARANRFPLMFDEYPEVLRLAWYEVRDVNAIYKQNADAPKSRRREIADQLKVKEAKFGYYFDLWMDGKPIDAECTCTERDNQACPACVEKLETQAMPY